MLSVMRCARSGVRAQSLRLLVGHPRLASTTITPLLKSRGFPVGKVLHIARPLLALPPNHRAVRDFHASQPLHVLPNLARFAIFAFARFLGPYLKVFTLKRVAVIAGVGAALASAFVYSKIETNPITGRRQVMLFSPEQIKQLGAAADQELTANWEGHFVSKDDEHYKLIAYIVSRLTKNPAAQLQEWTLDVLDVDFVNCFVLPTGHIFVTKPMIQMVGANPHALAFLIGHEMAHVICRHSAEDFSWDAIRTVLQVAAYFLIGLLIGDQTSFFMALFGDLASDVLLHLPHSRADEMQADEVGLLMAAEACYDPRVAPNVWQAMMDASKDDPTANIDFLSTHPSHESRRGTLQELMPSVMECMSPDCAHAQLVPTTTFMDIVHRFVRTNRVLGTAQRQLIDQAEVISGEVATSLAKSTAVLPATNALPAGGAVTAAQATTEPSTASPAASSVNHNGDSTTVEQKEKNNTVTPATVAALPAPVAAAAAPSSAGAAAAAAEVKTTHTVIEKLETVSTATSSSGTASA